MRVVRDGKGENKDGIWNLAVLVSKVPLRLPSCQHHRRPAEFKPSIYNLTAIPGFSVVMNLSQARIFIFCDV